MFSILQLSYTFSIFQPTYTYKYLCKSQNTKNAFLSFFLPEFGCYFLPCTLLAQGKQHIESPNNKYQIYEWLFCDLHSY